MTPFTSKISDFNVFCSIISDMKGDGMLMKSIIETEHISIRFKDTQALKDLSFKVYEGEIFGFLGPSGAGKTTTIKLLTKQLKQDEGNIFLFEKPIAELHADLYQNIGVLSDNSGLYEKLSVYDNLKVFAEICRLPMASIDDVLEKTGLAESRKKKVKDLSKGMRQRLLFSRAILNKPKILFLDEPTSSLDPATSEAVHKMILELNHTGTTIFLTTHNMSEADKLCNRVAFLHRGEIVETGSPNELKLKYAENEVRILTSNNIEYKVERDVQKIIKVLQNMDGNLMRIISKEPDLKSIFLRITGRDL